MSVKNLVHLKNTNIIKNTIKKVQPRNGSIVTDKDDQLSDNPEDLCLVAGKLNKNDDFDSPLTINKLGPVLKRMKCNNTPGFDGITSEFLKMFWGKLKHYVVHMLNRCFEKGQLSVTLRQSIIICLPKGNKERSPLKNWRPISFLFVVYKLASGVIADRLKESLNKITSNCQNEFIKGRYISDSIRLIYDALEIAETHKIPGLLMCINYEKAFNSSS